MRVIFRIRLLLIAKVIFAILAFIVPNKVFSQDKNQFKGAARVDQSFFENIDSAVTHHHKAKTLFLSRRGVKILSDDVRKLQDLEVLIVSGNPINLADLIEKTATLNKLKRLDISFCNLDSIPKSIYQLQSLQVLNISGNNKVKYLPNSLSAIRSLKKVIFSENQNEFIGWSTADKIKILQALPGVDIELYILFGSHGRKNIKVSRKNVLAL